jgi:sugar phosphate isomerase/epimerase
VALAARAGLTGVQLDFGGPGRAERLDTPGLVPALRRRASDSGVQLLAVAGNLLNDIGLTAPAGTAEAARVRDLIERMLDTAAGLGCPLVFVPSFRRSAIDGPQALRRTAEVLAWAAREAEPRGLTFANENTLPPSQALTLVERVGVAGFRLVLDVYNLPRAGVDAPGVVGELAAHLADQVHLKDGADGDTTVPLGRGDGGIGTTLDALARSAAPVRFLVLENDYRDGDLERLGADVAWARERARTTVGNEEGNRV